MSPRNQTHPQHLGPDRLKPAEGTPILDASVEAQGPATDLCTGRAPRDGARRAHILAWLAGGAREVTWALCSLAREHWAEFPPTPTPATQATAANPATPARLSEPTSARLGDWPALRHARHLALYEARQTLPAVREALGESAADTPALSKLELEQADAAWDPKAALESAEAILRDIADLRFELLQRVETAPEDDHLDWLLLSAKQREMQHVAAIWKIALNWDRGSSEPEKSPTPGVPLHAADRPEESH